tara:strand:+ start:955 stop:2319 length:1365 start_codon:yes stop_codon:yes gene_type:complete
MALVPHTVQTLARTDSEGSGGNSNVVSGAVITATDINGAPALMYDDALKSNPSTAKTTDSDGKREVWVFSGVYTFTVNGKSSKVDLSFGSVSGWDVGQTYSVDDLVEKDGVIFKSMSNSNAGNDPSTATPNWRRAEKPQGLKFAGSGLTGSGLNLDVDDGVIINGLTRSGDGFSGTAIPTGGSGVASQTPFDTDSRYGYDANGDEYEWIPESATGFNFVTAPMLIAHRGFRDLGVQNTLPAFRQSIELGADAIELDVRTSADGTPYVFHDVTVDALTDGTGTLTDLTDSYIDSLRYTEADGTSLEGVGIPRLSTVLRDAKKHGGMIFAEIKSGDYVPMMDAVKSAGLSHRVNWSSFVLSTITDASKLDPYASYGYLVDGNLAAMQSAVDSVSAIAGKWTIIGNKVNILASPGIVPYAKDRGVDIAAYTVEDSDEAHNLAEIGVYMLISDRNTRP